MGEVIWIQVQKQPNPNHKTYTILLLQITKHWGSKTAKLQDTKDMKLVKTSTLQSQLVSEGLMLKYLAPIELLDSDVPSNTNTRVS